MWSPRHRCGDLATLAGGATSTSAGRVVTTAATIGVDRIVGTIARCCDFDRCFQPLRRHLASQLKAVRRHFAHRELPPIRVLRVDGDYYVVDGHHRVALARERGMAAVDALVTVRVTAAAS